MFEANHQCIITTKIYSTASHEANSSQRLLNCAGLYCETRENRYREGNFTVVEKRFESVSAWHRCDPYEWWSKLHLQCTRNPSIDHISLIFDHSINGGPFYRIVDVRDVCSLSYDAFTHNSWIKLPPEAPVVGYPVQNVYEI
jgi:hypothetical protein